MLEDGEHAASPRDTVPQACACPIEILTLDEADRLLDLGFLSALRHPSRRS
jgi:hypothetical protein